MIGDPEKRKKYDQYGEQWRQAEAFEKEEPTLPDNIKQRRNQELQLESVKKSLYKEIQQAYYNAVNSSKKLESSEAAARSAEDAFTLMSAKYEGGKANITEFNESKNRYLEAESNFLQARYEYLYQTKILDFYRGVELDF